MALQKRRSVWYSLDFLLDEMLNCNYIYLFIYNKFQYVNKNAMRLDKQTRYFLLLQKRYQEIVINISKCGPVTLFVYILLIRVFVWKQNVHFHLHEYKFLSINYLE